MRPLYAARLEDLGSGDFVQVECVCWHTMLLTAQMLATAGVPGCEVKWSDPAR